MVKTCNLWRVPSYSHSFGTGEKNGNQETIERFLRVHPQIQPKRHVRKRCQTFIQAKLLAEPVEIGGEHRNEAYSADDSLEPLGYHSRSWSYSK